MSYYHLAKGKTRKGSPVVTREGEKKKKSNKKKTKEKKKKNGASHANLPDRVERVSAKKLLLTCRHKQSITGALIQGKLRPACTGTAREKPSHQVPTSGRGGKKGASAAKMGNVTLRKSYCG